MRGILALFAILVAAAALSAPVEAQADRTIMFGISLALYPPEGQAFPTVQYDALRGLNYWKDWFNSKPEDERRLVTGESFYVDLHVATFSDYTNTEENKLALYDVYRQMSLNSSIHHLIMPVASPWDIPLRNFTYYELGVEYMVAISDSSESYYATPGSFGSVTANIMQMTSYLPYLRVQKAKSVAVVRVNEVFQLELCKGVLDQAEVNDLEVAVDHTVMPEGEYYFDYNTFGIVNTPERIAEWNGVLDRVIEADVDALFICDYGLASEYAVQYLKDKNWTPKSLTITTLVQDWEDMSNLNFLTSVQAFDRGAKFPAQDNVGTCEEYASTIETQYGGTASSVTARATLAGMIYSNALINAKGNSSTDIRTALATGQFQSFMGTSAFDTSSRQTLPALAVQWLQNKTEVNVIGPAQAAAEELIYPIPTWEERIFDPKWGHGTEIAAVVLMGIGGVVTIGWMIFLFIHRSNKVIFAASPLFLVAILVGSLIIYVSILTWMPNLAGDSICNLRAWLLPLGFMTMFGALLAKTHRIHRLYNSKGINILVIRNIQVALITLVIVVGQAVLSILMITVTSLKSEIKTVDPFRISLNYRVCTFSTALKVLFGINVGYAFALLMWGSYLAYKIRKVPISVYDESKVIAFSIYNTCFFGVIVIVIQLAVGDDNRHLTFMLTAVCCFLGAMITTGCLMGAKLWAIYKPGKDHKSSGTLGTSSSGDASRSKNTTSTGSIARESGHDSRAKKYRKKYKAMKARAKDQQERIRQLEALAKSHGFLEEVNDIEMAPTTTTTTTEPKSPKEAKKSKSPGASTHDKFAPKAPENDIDDSSSDSD